MESSRVTELLQILPMADIKERQFIRKEILRLVKPLESPDLLVPYLKSTDYLVRECTVDALSVIKHESCVGYIVELLETEDDKSVQMAAIYALRDIGTFSSVQALMKIADSEKYTVLVQSLAIQSLAISILNVLIAPLFEVLKTAISTSNLKIVESIFDAFEILENDKNNIPNHLLELIASRNVPDYFLIYIISYLGERRYAQAFDAILPFLDSDDRELQRAAVEALGKLGIPKAIPVLENKLNHEDELVRYKATVALQRLKTDRK
ncbi:MAG: HEAT repeat domain-containing protein [Anaerolineaceae bacterium]|nr:HEAT repeat domain-containing protein [Anaerolineaceae bacterium]